MPEIFSQNTAPPAGQSPALSAFVVRPKGIRFETQEPEEEILLLMRKHPVTNLGWLSLLFFILVGPILGLPVLLRMNILPVNVPPGYFLILPLLWYLGAVGFALANFLQWYFNVYIITNQRIVDIDWVSLLYKQLSSAQLNKIQDVTYKQGGLWDSFFDFGNVFIQTAGSEPNFEFESVPRPNQVVREISKIVEEHK